MDFNQNLAKAELPRETVQKCLHLRQRIPQCTSKELEEYIIMWAPVSKVFLVKHENIQSNSILILPMTAKKNRPDATFESPPPLRWNHRLCQSYG